MSDTSDKGDRHIFVLLAPHAMSFLILLLPLDLWIWWTYNPSFCQTPMSSFTNLRRHDIITISIQSVFMQLVKYLVGKLTAAAPGSLVTSSWNMFGGKVCCNTCRSWWGCPLIETAFTKCSTPASIIPVKIQKRVRCSSLFTENQWT